MTNVRSLSADWADVTVVFQNVLLRRQLWQSHLLRVNTFQQRGRRSLGQGAAGRHQGSAEDQRPPPRPGALTNAWGDPASPSPSRRVRTERRGLQLGRSARRAKLGAVGGPLLGSRAPDVDIFGNFWIVNDAAVGGRISHTCRCATAVSPARRSAGCRAHPLGSPQPSQRDPCDPRIETPAWQTPRRLSRRALWPRPAPSQAAGGASRGGLPAPCSLPDSGNGVGTRLSSHPPAAENETRRAATAQPGRGRRSRRGSPPPRPHSVHRPPPPSDAPPSSSCPRPRFAPLPPGGPFLLCLGQARLLIPPGPLPERSSIPALIRIRCECHLLGGAFPDCPDGSALAKASLVAVWSAHRCRGPRT